jgi:hypothetical protein
MGGACSIHGRDEKCTKFWLENLKGRRVHSENLGVHGTVILEWTVGK